VTAQDEGSAAVKQATAPDPDDPRKPESPPDLHMRSWKHTAKLALAEFKRDQCVDSAAALTYYAVLSVFPAFIVGAAMIGLIGNGQDTADALIELITDLGQEDVADQLEGPIESLAESRGAGLALVVGVALALWSASAYVGAFGRAMNRIYEVDEGRPIWKLRPLNIVISLVLIICATLMLTGAAMSGGLANEIGERIGLSDTAVTVWNIVKWPAMLLVLALMVAVLYYATPNVRQPKFRWMSVGAALAIALWVLGSVAFGFYVQNFGNYDKTYGSLGGVIILLLWLWLTNIALLFGAEVDAELERARELQAGIEAEETLQLPPRDTKQSEKAAESLAEDIAAGRELRLQATERQRAIDQDDGVDTDVRVGSHLR
jgi:membrane protein